MAQAAKQAGAGGAAAGLLANGCGISPGLGAAVHPVADRPVQVEPKGYGPFSARQLPKSREIYIVPASPGQPPR
jgi:hypothetical protein